MRGFRSCVGLRAGASASCSISCSTWIDVGSLHADIAFWLDPLSAVMILVVTGVGGLIHIYSIGYMHDEPSRTGASSRT